ncbi:unnamed protein product [Cylindrotheca closterium]|uniref:Uncharacterized protein n=1 Tax=Cylindrotheca closterium TaxID=2856 RepID=A0AAD2PW89_9STRA|nr:unnamed protein product [Cylindrotheca closterium]
MLLLVVLLVIALFFLSYPNESLQLLPYSLEDLQQSNPFGLSATPKTTTDSSSDVDDGMNLLLYITTHFSAQHLRYFHCCWPKLVQESPLISSAHVLIVASNHTPVDSTELNYLSNQLFQHNPSYQIHFLDQYNDNNPCEKFRNEVPKGSNANNNPLKLPVNYKQCMANLGVRAGFEHGWVYGYSSHDTTNSGGGGGAITGEESLSSKRRRRRRISYVHFDWMIRINPDVLIRKSKWLLETMRASMDALPRSVLLDTTTTLLSTTTSPPLIENNATLAIVVHCATRQLHTDFFALRPHHWGNHHYYANDGENNNSTTTAITTATTTTTTTTAFSKMGRKGNKWNHERTAYKEMAHLWTNGNSNIKYLPDVDPSEGSCRVRGKNASVYHVHDSCQEEGGGGADMECLALDGWDLSQL